MSRRLLPCHLVVPFSLLLSVWRLRANEPRVVWTRRWHGEHRVAFPSLRTGVGSETALCPARSLCRCWALLGGCAFLARPAVGLFFFLVVVVPAPRPLRHFVLDLFGLWPFYPAMGFCLGFETRKLFRGETAAHAHAPRWDEMTFLRGGGSGAVKGRIERSGRCPCAPWQP